MSPEVRVHSFDDLARGLASGTLSRGKALRLMGPFSAPPLSCWPPQTTCKGAHGSACCTSL